MIVAWEVRAYVDEQDCQGPVFFDRALPEAAAMLGLPPPAHFARAAARFRFAPRVFIAPAWREIYHQDEERKQTWEEAVENNARCRAAYAHFGYDLVDLPLASVEDRADFILAACGLTAALSWRSGRIAPFLLPVIRHPTAFEVSRLLVPDPRPHPPTRPRPSRRPPSPA